jgi:SAM-dependent methyltransferase
VSAEAAVPSPQERPNTLLGPSGDLFVVSVLILFLELACIRWFPAHVLFLTFFTNVVLLACFLGMSVGCLAANSKRNWLRWTPVLLLILIASGYAVEIARTKLEQVIDVGNQSSPELIMFGTEYHSGSDRFFIPIEALAAFFFLLLALAFVGPGQELGRAFDRIPDRVRAYSINVFGSLVGIVLFGLFAYLQLSPFWWFLPASVMLAYLLLPYGWAGRALVPLLVLLPFVSVSEQAVPYVNDLIYSTRDDAKPPTLEHYWSPYYRIDLSPNPGGNYIYVNLISHQRMWSTMQPYPAYGLPHLMRRDSEARPFEEILIIGAGSGTDVSRALQWGAKHIDAVEIDPVIYKLGKRDHPDKPYDDPRVTVHLDDGRNFLRAAPAKKYDLVIYALVDSLVLHSGQSSIRLESYLFTEQAFRDIERVLKPDGVFMSYNYFRQGWIVQRLHDGLEKVFGSEPIVMTYPSTPVVKGDGPVAFGVVIAGHDETEGSRLAAFKKAFEGGKKLRVRAREPITPDSPNGFGPVGGEVWEFFPSKLEPTKEPLRLATDDWPFLYLRRPTLPSMTLRSIALMGGIGLLLVWIFLPKRQPGGVLFDGRMFFLGAGFMLIETKAVVHMALLFGSTWMVNSVVFFSVLVMILLANLFVLKLRPSSLWVCYAGLFAALALNTVVPLDYFLGMERTTQVVLSCLLVFAPVLFAGVIFAVSFSRTTDPARAMGANIAGVMLGGLAENISMQLGFQYLVLVALGFYVLSALFSRRAGAAISR